MAFKVCYFVIYFITEKVTFNYCDLLRAGHEFIIMFNWHCSTHVQNFLSHVIDEYYLKKRMYATCDI